jgi:hypothetical protein
LFLNFPITVFAVTPESNVVAFLAKQLGESRAPAAGADDSYDPAHNLSPFWIFDSKIGSASAKKKG